ncbi:hypothetical protein [Neobacillus sp. LXY-4]|uniref:hypothetical protein n=1 Tax=Neobacillus sp. LXY-4 TaxID=3379826 RepID=UPI003EE27602
MLGNCKEEDFYQIKSVGQDRLSPQSISGFFWAVIFVSVLTTIATSSGLFPEDNDVSTAMVLILLLSYLMLFIQFIFTLFFTFKKVAYKFERFQSLCLSFIGLKFSIDFYLAFFDVCERFNSPNYIRNTGLILMGGGAIFLIIFTLRAFKRVSQGKLRQGENGLYDFQNSKGYVSVPVIFGVTMFGGATARLFSDTASNFEVLGMLFFAVLLQYSLALALPEFFLLMYCKFRFETFRVELPKKW